MLRGRMAAVLCCLFGVFALGLVACGDDDDDGGGGGGGGTAQGDTLTIYSTLPLQGGAEQLNRAIVNGAKLALKQNGGKAGRYRIKYVSLDDSLASTGAADEGREAQNARKAVQDKSTIAVIGAYNSGMTKVSLPILNKAGILQVSPSNTAVGLTTDEPGSEPGEPEKFYRTGKRTYARVVPKDDIQAAALIKAAKDENCESFHIFNSKTAYSAGLARNLELAAEKDGGVEVTGNDGIDIKAPNYRSLVDRVNADCVISTVETENNGVQILKDAGTALPQARLFGSDGVVSNDTADPRKGLPPAIAARFTGTIATLGLEEFRKRRIVRAVRFFEDFEATYGEDQPDPYAIYGYESMKLILDSIEAAGPKGNDRQAVIDQVLKNTKGRESVLGTYDIDQNGDTTLTDYGRYKIEDGKLVFVDVLKGN
jgi:branched-chain amino acid transport system substrate-binding protein